MTGSTGMKYSTICIKQVIWTAGGIGSVFVRTTPCLVRVFTSRRNFRAQAKPMPLDPPVMTTCFPLKLFMLMDARARADLLSEERIPCDIRLSFKLHCAGIVLHATTTFLCQQTSRHFSHQFCSRGNVTSLKRQAHHSRRNSTSQH